MDLGVPVAMTLAVVVVGWFFLGMQWNVHKGQRLLRWMREGLPLLSERTTLQWVGTSLVRLGMREAKPPFREVEILLVFEPRDVPFLWLFSRQYLRGVTTQPRNSYPKIPGAGSALGGLADRRISRV
jgi:hypothetical protein